MGLWNLARIFMSKVHWSIPDLDGREVDVVFKAKVPEEDAKRLERLIHLVCKGEKVAKKFVKLKINVVHRKKNVAGWINSAAVNGEDTIHLNYPFIMNASDAQIYVMITHEITHLWHSRINNILARKSKYLKRLAKVRKKPKGMRDALGIFFHSVAIEGVAEFFSEKSLGLAFSKANFNEDYDYAVNDVNHLHNVWWKYVIGRKVSREKMMEEIRAVLQGVSFHVVYTIAFAGKKSRIKMEAVANMKHFQIIKEYEKAMDKMGLQPVISVTSGQGILDYDRMLAELESRKKMFN